MTLKITQRGWENYNGNLFGVEFVNSESVGGYSHRQAGQIAALIQIEDENGKNPSVSQQIIDMKHTPMDQDMVRDMQTGELTTGAKINAAIEAKAKVWTVEELNEIADTKGINGVREVAEPLGVRGREIAALISGILKTNGPKEEQPQAPKAE